MTGTRKIGIVIVSVALTVVAGAFWEKHASRYDKVILEEIRSHVAADESLKNTEVSVARGVVLLTGSVKVLEDQRRVVKETTSLEHIRRVNNKLLIDTSIVPDLRLRLQIKQAVRDEGLREVRIKVKRGTVTVRGPVRGIATHERVLTQVASTEGVRAIDDRLTVVD